MAGLFGIELVECPHCKRLLNRRGHCALCRGTGQVVSGFFPFTEEKAERCQRCDGTGICPVCAGCGYLRVPEM